MAVEGEAQGTQLRHRRATRPRRTLRACAGLLSGLMVGLVLLGLSALALSDRTIRLPGWAVARIEARVNRALGGQARVLIDGAALVLGGDRGTEASLDGVTILDAGGQPLARLGDLGATLSAGLLLRGEASPEALRLSGAEVTLRRAADGRLDLDFAAPGKPAAKVVAAPPAPPVAGPAAAPTEAEAREAAQTALPVLAAAIDRAFALPFLDRIDSIEADRLTLVLEDARAGQTWRAEDGRMTLVQTAGSRVLTGGFDLAGTGSAPGHAAVRLVIDRATRAGTLDARIDDVPAPDIATQAPALAWLGVLDAPISLDFHGGIDGAGVIGRLDGALRIGAGALRPTPRTRPVPFDGARMQATYFPAEGKARFTGIEVESPTLRVRADATAYLRDVANGLPKTILVQFGLHDVTVDPDGLFEAPVSFPEGALDVRLRLDPFRAEIGQMALVDGPNRVGVSGTVGAGPDGWSVALDLGLDQIASDRLLALWPVRLVPQTRAWLVENIAAGQLFNARGGMRIAPGAPPRLSLGWEFRHADVRFIKTLPPVADGTGYATVTGDSFNLMIERGRVDAPEGGPIDVAGTVFEVPDIRAKPARASVRLKAKGGIRSALSVLDAPPFEFLSKAGQPVGIAEGRADVVATIGLPLVPKLGPGDVRFEAAARLSDVTSTTLVPGRTLAAPSLTLATDNDGISIRGAGALDGLPVDASWTQAFGPDAGPSRVTGTVELSQRAVSTLRLGLPDGAVGGQGEGQFELDLARGAAPRFHLASDLAGVSLRVPEIGWSKPAARGGSLDVAGTLGTTPSVERLALDAGGLSASGRVSIQPSGALGAASFGRVRIGGWFDGPVTLTGRGPGRAVGVDVGGGRLDLRRATLGGGSGGGGGGDAVPISVRLDRLEVSDSIALTGFAGTFDTAGGFNGTFRASVNGGARVSGRVAPSGTRSAVMLAGDDAGAVFRAAGLTDKVVGGALSLRLTPSGRASYNGNLRVTDTRVRDAPALADLLGAISVIGLLEQLGGDGIVFGTMRADFHLTPDVLEVTEASAVGPSLGVSLAGLYGLASKRFDMQGVVSPVYILNGIGAALTRRGEGLFGFNYALTGTSSAPEVGVNPLSILTPGMFREIFRSPPPTVAR